MGVLMKVLKSVDRRSGFQEVGCCCVVVGEGVGWKEVEL
jgi:hypothetical protein